MLLIFFLGFHHKKKKILDDLPDSIKKHLPKCDGCFSKEILSAHKLSLNPIKKSTETFFTGRISVKRYGSTTFSNIITQDNKT